MGSKGSGGMMDQALRRAHPVLYARPQKLEYDGASEAGEDFHIGPYAFAVGAEDLPPASLARLKALAAGQKVQIGQIECGLMRGSMHLLQWVVRAASQAGLGMGEGFSQN